VCGKRGAGTCHWDDPEQATLTGVDGVVERYGEATTVRTFDGRSDRVTEMDALVAYLQILGRLTDLPEQIEPLPEE